MPSAWTARRACGADAGAVVLTDRDLDYLRRAVALAEEALARGNPPFGSLLVDGAGKVLVEETNQVRTGERLHHPEIAVARWAGAHLGASARAAATVYTSGEHCAMCAAAHGWLGLGRIVYAASSAQLAGWLAEWGVPRGHVRDLAIGAVIAGVAVDGPAPELAGDVRKLQRRFFRRPAP